MFIVSALDRDRERKRVLEEPAFDMRVKVKERKIESLRVGVRVRGLVAANEREREKERESDRVREN